MYAGWHSQGKVNEKYQGHGIFKILERVRELYTPQNN